MVLRFYFDSKKHLRHSPYLRMRLGYKILIMIVIITLFTINYSQMPQEERKCLFESIMKYNIETVKSILLIILKFGAFSLRALARMGFWVVLRRECLYF